MNADFQEGYHYDRLIEQRVLGQLLIERDAFSRIYGRLKPEWFYDDGHQIVFRCMLEMHDAGKPIESPSVRSELIGKKITTINNINVGAYLIGLENNVVNTVYLEYYCHVLREVYRRRKIIEIQNTKRDLYNPTEAQVVIQAEYAELNSSIGFDEDGDGWMDMTLSLVETWRRRIDLMAGKIPTITTGIKQLDYANSGFLPGQMIVIGSRPSVGKSALMAKMALDIAKTGKKVGIVSLEMSTIEITGRMIAIETNRTFDSIFNHADEQQDRVLFKEMAAIEKLPIWFSDKSRATVGHIREKTLLMKRKHGCDIIFIDYLQLLESVSTNKNYNREQEVARMSRAIKMLAVDLEIPVVVLCQLNRESVNRAHESRRPRLSDLRESGAIEQDADIVLFLHRDWAAGIREDEDGNTTEFFADLICAKWRNGKTGLYPLMFDPPKMRFYETENPPQFRPPTESNQDDNPF